MKLLKNKKINSKHIFELQLIKSKTYAPFIKSYSFKKPKLNLSNTIIDFKKALNIIFKYHKHNKRILFIGSPKIIENLINLNTIHSSVPDFFCLKNKITMNNHLYKNIKLNKHFFNQKKFLLSKIKKKPELVVVFNHNKKESIIKETSVAKIPTIEFNSTGQQNQLNNNYNVLSRIAFNKNKNIDNIFFAILNSLFSNTKHL